MVGATQGRVLTVIFLKSKNGTKCKNFDVLPYKMKYWRGVNFGGWRFLDKIANI